MRKELIIFIIKHEFVASHFFLVSLMYLLNKKNLCLLKLIFQSNVVAFLEATTEDSGKTQGTISEEADVLASPTRQRLRSMANASLQLRNT